MLLAFSVGLFCFLIGNQRQIQICIIIIIDLFLNQLCHDWAHYFRENGYSLYVCVSVIVDSLKVEVLLEKYRK